MKAWFRTVHPDRRYTMLCTVRKVALFLAAALLSLLGTGRAAAQPVVVSPRVVTYTPATPVVTYSYYSPPVVYTPAPAVSYYAPTTVTYYPTTVTYYTPAVSYAAVPAVVAPAATVTTTRYGLLGRRQVTTTRYYA